MRPRNKIQKRPLEQSLKKRRGRPQKYSESWIKKLIILRMCGLDTNAIVRILEIQCGGPAEAKVRRAQQLVAQLLSDGQQRFGSADKLAARRRAAFIRASFRPDGRRNSRPIKNKVPSYKALIRNGAASLTCQMRWTTTVRCSPQNASSPMLDDEAVAKSGPHTDGSPAWSAVSDDALQLTRPASFSPVSVASHKSMRRSVLDDAALPTPAVATTSQNTSTDIAGCRDSTVLSPSRMYKVLEVLHQRTSFSSSNISDILSLIDRRLSLSTLTSSRRSMFAASITETELSYAEGKAAEVVERVCQTITRANLALIEDCCGNTEDCRHRFISELSDNDPHLIWLSQLDLDVELTAIPVIQSSQDSYGNSELFFAARIGAAADVILSLLRVTDNVNAVNADGQTFLYFLNPRFFHFQGPHCRCVGSDPHRSRFECLVCALDRQGYNFDLLDNYGRPFLFFLCASPHFDYRWLLDLMLHDNEWRNRVRHISQLRDANGLFLIDFMVLHPAFDSLDEGLVSQFRPLFSYSPNRVDEFEVLHNEDKQGRSRLHQYVQGDWLHEAPRNEVAWPFRGGLPLENVCDINRYDGHGRTPIMDLLLRAFDQSLAEDFICAKVKLLLVCGANVNARSRGGSTVLHFAAKKAMPLLLQMLLETNIQVDHRDEAGLSALDYAAKVLQRSRSVKSRVELMARSLKSTAQLLSRERAMDGQRATKDVHVRIQQTLQQLSGTQQQNYPPSLPKGFPLSRR